MQDYRITAAPIIREFLTYHEATRGHSSATVDAYYSDIKFFIGWLHMQERPKDPDAVYDESITLDTLKQIRKTDIYEYMAWLKRDRKLDSATRARRLSVVKALFYYLVSATNQMDVNPAVDIKPPRIRKSLPAYLTKDQAEQLLAAPTGTYELRDKTILMLFMVCGLRVSELVGLDLDKVHKEDIKVLGKGNKERVIFLSKPMQEQMRSYLDVRYALKPVPGHEKALFLSNRYRRISVRRVQSMVDERLKKAGLDSTTYSPHKLRHTAATLMLQNGVDVRVLQEILGHERLDTTQIYTHVDDADLRLAANANPLGKKEM